MRLWLAAGVADMRPRLSQSLKQVPLSGHLFVFRGRCDDLIKIIWSDRQGACPSRKRSEKLSEDERPRAFEVLSITLSEVEVRQEHLAAKTTGLQA